MMLKRWNEWICLCVCVRVLYRHHLYRDRESRMQYHIRCNTTAPWKKSSNHWIRYLFICLSFICLLYLLRYRHNWHGLIKWCNITYKWLKKKSIDRFLFLKKFVKSDFWRQKRSKIVHFRRLSRPFWVVRCFLFTQGYDIQCGFQFCNILSWKRNGLKNKKKSSMKMLFIWLFRDQKLSLINFGRAQKKTAPHFE